MNKTNTDCSVEMLNEIYQAASMGVVIFLIYYTNIGIVITILKKKPPPYYLKKEKSRKELAVEKKQVCGWESK